MCERERIQLTDTEFSVSFCVQFINCLKWRIQILFWWDFFPPSTQNISLLKYFGNASQK